MITSEVVGIRANVDDVVCGLSDAADADIPELFQVSDDFMNQLDAVLKPYGYHSHSSSSLKPNTLDFIKYIEFRCAYRKAPWAILLFPHEYRLSGHFLSMRPDRSMIWTSYSLAKLWIDNEGNVEPREEPIPLPLSVIIFYSKSSLAGVAEISSPLFKTAWDALKTCAEDKIWITIAPSLDQQWVIREQVISDELHKEYFKIRYANK